MKTTSLLLALPALVVLGACSGKPKHSDTPTSGNTHITVDESYQPMIDAELDMFHALYHHAHVDVTYLSENQTFQQLIDDSSKVIIASRELNDQEKAFFDKKKVIPRVTHIANDGLAFIVNTGSPATRLLYGQVGEMFSGKISSWDQINPAFPKDSIRVVFDNPGSANVRLIREKFNLGDTLPANVFAVNSNSEVVNYVEKHPNTIGIISVNWISDNSDSTTISFLKKIKVLDIGEVGSTDTAGYFYGPYQGYIANESYPFIRKTYVINCEGRTGLGTGFAAFIAGEKGQRIILRAGMVPAVAPVRLVEVNTN